MVNYMPTIGQSISVKDKSTFISGKIIAIDSDSQTVKLLLETGIKEIYAFNQIVDVAFTFGSFDDAIFHLHASGQNRHCKYCYTSLLYAIDLLTLEYKSQPFMVCSTIIRNGLMSYLSKDFPTAAYALVPQIEGIINQILYEDGLLKQTNGFPIWTKEHADEKYHHKQCRNMVDAIKGAHFAGKSSRLSHLLKWDVIDTANLKELRNKLLHGTLLDVKEHEVSSLIYLIQAIHHEV